MALLHLKGLEELLKLPDIVDSSPNNRCLVTLAKFKKANQDQKIYVHK